MKIEAFILCWNEAKMVRHTLRHYSQFCDKITVIDNQSDDGTQDIIRKHFPAVEITEYDSEGKINDALYTDIKNTCWKDSDADYVIVCDMDELLYINNIQGLLKNLYDIKIRIPQTKGYNMLSDNFPDDYYEPITEQIQHGMEAVSLELLKQGIKAPSMNKSIIFSPKYVKDINYLPGAHDCIPELKEITIRKGFVPHQTRLPILLLHMKYLGRDYLKERFKLYAGRLSEYNIKNGYGAEYLRGDAWVDEAFDLIEKHKIRVI